MHQSAVGGDEQDGQREAVERGGEQVVRASRSALRPIAFRAASLLAGLRRSPSRAERIVASWVLERSVRLMPASASAAPSSASSWVTTRYLIGLPQGELALPIYIT
jgi:hypothetical protein